MYKILITVWQACSNKKLVIKLCVWIFYIENEIDGDAFVLLTSDSVKSMIKKQGLVLKFEHKFNELKGKNLEQTVLNRTVVSEEESNNDQPSSIESLSKLKNVQQAMSIDVIQEQSKIYGRYKEHAKLSSWQKAVNSAAFVIAQETPDKLYDRSQLKLAAEEKARATYVFKKKSGSRSKFEPAKEMQKRRKMSTSERNEEIASCLSRIRTMTSEITEFERDIDKARVTKRSDESKSKTSSSDYDDAVQKDIRHFLKSSSSNPHHPNAEEKIHGPQSDDTLILSSDEENCGQAKDEDFTDGASVCSSIEGMGSQHSVSKKRMVNSMESPNQLEDKDESEVICDNEKRKRIKFDLENQVENNTKFSEDSDLLIQTQKDGVGFSQVEEDKEVENILGSAKQDPVNVMVENERNNESFASEKVEMEKSPFL